MLPEDEVRADMLAQEDGRGGHTYDSRPLGDGMPTKKVGRKKGSHNRVPPHACKWCGMRMETEGDYHPPCLEEKNILNRYDRMEEKPVQANPNNVGKHWTNKGGPKWNGQTTR